MRSLKTHWISGKTWVFFWDEERVWVVLRPSDPARYFSSFGEAWDHVWWV